MQIWAKYYQCRDRESGLGVLLLLFNIQRILKQVRNRIFPEQIKTTVCSLYVKRSKNFFYSICTNDPFATTNAPRTDGGTKPSVEVAMRIKKIT